MKRKLDIEEIRRFFDTANTQFEEAGIVLHRVKFNRIVSPDTGEEKVNIELAYTEIPKDMQVTGNQV